MRIIWVPHSLNPVYAGVRLRCLLPHAVLSRLGYTVSIAKEDTDLAAASVLVVQGKWLLDAQNPEQLQRRMSRLETAKAAGVKLVLDSFDNYFLNETGDPARARLLEAYRACLPRFDRFTVSSPGLVPFLRDVLGEAAVIDIIGDPLEGIRTHWLYESTLQRAYPGRWVGHIRAYQDRLGVRYARKRERRLMWFGSHGSSYATGGMSQLSRILPSLQDIATRVPLHLTVVSNSRAHFDSIVSGFNIPCTYRGWDRLHFIQLLLEQDLVLLPTEINNFTASKSNNRLLLPLSHAVPVITDALPDYVPWRNHCAIDEWHRLEQYIDDPNPLQRRAQAIARRLTEEFSPRAIADQWLTMFHSIESGDNGNPVRTR